MTPPARNILAIVGTTASGKSALAMALAEANPAIELVSVDSMQVYRGMDIGTAKPTADEQAAVQHHMIDVADPWDDYTVSAFQRDALAAIASIEAAGRTPVLVGGTGLHLRSVVDGLEIPGQFPEARAEIETEPDTETLHRRLAELDPVAAGRMEPNNRRRVVRALEVCVGSGRRFSEFGPGLEEYAATRFRLVGLRWARATIDHRIAVRYDQQMRDGFVDEVRALLAGPHGLSRTARQALGYRQLIEHLETGVPVDEALQNAIIATRRFARRQERWFRRDPRITWIDIEANPMEAHPRIVGEWPECI